MFGSNQNSASVTLQVKGISEIRGMATNDKSVYTVVAQSYGKTLYGTNHIGNQSGWQDTFVINLKDLQNDDLTLTAFVNDNEVGSTNLSLYDISSTAAGNYESEYQIKLEKDGVPSGSLSVALQRLLKQQVIGGLAPPTITLRSDAVIVEEKGLQKISASKLNFFSCMDEKEKGWEFYPYKFKTRLRYNYSASQSLKSIMESNMQ